MATTTVALQRVGYLDAAVAVGCAGWLMNDLTGPSAPMVKGGA